MSWFYDLYKTYENNFEEVGIIREKKNGTKYTLLPVSHMEQAAHIEVTLDEYGEFLKAHVLDKEDSATIVPCTEQSATRSSNISPHLLHDKLKYVAGDYVKYMNDIKFEPHHAMYMKNLNAWCESEFSHKDIQSVHDYLEKGTLINDLIKAGILFLDDEKLLLRKWTREMAKEQGDKPPIFDTVTDVADQTFIRFNVLSSDNVPLMENREIQQLVTEYVKSTFDNKGVCYVTGKTGPIAGSHPKYLRWAGDDTKLISANDKGFNLYQGRFTDKKDVVMIGYETSQKAHHALKWLIQKQGRTKDGQVVVVWGDRKNDASAPYPGSFNFSEEKTAIDKTKEDYAKNVYRGIEGYRHQLNNEGNINILVLNSANDKGRLAVTYYQSLTQDDYLQRISDWHTSCYWKQTSSANKQPFYGTPSMYDIVLAAYGKGSTNKDRLAHKTIARLLPCVVERQKIPWDIVSASYKRAVNPMGKELWEWERSVNIACALIKKYYTKEAYEMSVDENNKDRSYLFGRLLAVADVLERRAKGYRFFKRTAGDTEDSNGMEGISGNKQPTNAMLYMQNYTKHPAKTWQMTYIKLIPYMRMFDGKGTRYEELINEITASFTIEDFNNKPLSPAFLIGFSSQKTELLKKSTKNQKEE